MSVMTAKTVKVGKYRGTKLLTRVTKRGSVITTERTSRKINNACTLTFSHGFWRHRISFVLYAKNKQYIISFAQFDRICIVLYLLTLPAGETMKPAKTIILQNFTNFTESKATTIILQLQW